MHRLGLCMLLAGVAACAPTTAPKAVAGGPTPSRATTPASTQSCIELTRIREAKVVDDRTIDFVVNGGGVLRNTLPYSCSGLGFERAFSYATSLSKLCSTDIISVIYQGGGPRKGASCGLGQFVPYTPVSAK